MYIRARFECKSVKQTLPIGNEKVRFEVTLRARDICEGDNASWSPNANPEGLIILVITDEAIANTFKPGKRYASCVVGCDNQDTWRHLLSRICNFGKRRQESSSAWSRFILWLMPAVQFASCTWIANALHVI